MKWYTPDMNDGQTIFVFGSNLAGRHGAGAERGLFMRRCQIRKLKPDLVKQTL